MWKAAKKARRQNRLEAESGAVEALGEDKVLRGGDDDGAMSADAGDASFEATGGSSTPCAAPVCPSSSTGAAWSQDGDADM